MHGRIEDIANPGSRLPAELTKPAKDNDQPLDSKDEWAKPDAKPLAPAAGNNGGFPPYALGRWGGRLQVMSRVIDRPDRGDSRINPGEEGFTVFRFVEDSHGVSVQPTSIFFARRKATPEEHKFARSLDPDNPNEAKAAYYNDYPIITLGGKHWTDGAGSAWDDKVVHHSFKMLSSNCGEEDIVFERSQNGDLYGYRESVVRFAWHGEHDAFAKVAVADYTVDRKPRKRTILAGFITQKWLDTASFIIGITQSSWADIEQKYGL
jgi:hypothetical protein